MNPVVIPNSGWKEILDDLTAAATGEWDGAKVHLFQNNIDPSPGDVLADYTEADFSGYAASATVVWGAAGYLPDGTAVVVGDAKTFATADPAPVLNTIYGWYLTNAGSTVLHFARKLDAPLVLSGVLQQLTVLPAYPAYLSV